MYRFAHPRIIVASISVLVLLLLPVALTARAGYVDPIDPGTQPNGGNTWRTTEYLNGVTWGDVTTYQLYKTLQLWYWDDVTSQFWARSELDTYTYYVSDAYYSIATPGKSHHDVCDTSVCVSAWTYSWN